uniref:PDZ domain-containing protein n=1 Tax=Macrostomum lignano TaxID=282301 RepID=A0A1I8IPD5_9PLAT
VLQAIRREPSSALNGLQTPKSCCGQNSRRFDCRRTNGVLGLRLQKKPDGLYIDFVKRGTSAHEAGLKDGDQVLKINSHIVTDWSMEGAMALLKSLSDTEPIALLVRETLPVANLAGTGPTPLTLPLPSHNKHRNQQAQTLQRQSDEAKSQNSRHHQQGEAPVDGAEPDEPTSSAAPAAANAVPTEKEENRRPKVPDSNPCASTDDLEITRLRVPPEAAGEAEAAAAAAGGPSTSGGNFSASNFFKSFHAPNRLTAFLKSSRFSRQQSQPQSKQQQSDAKANTSLPAKYTHNKDEKLLEADRKHYLKRPLWWIGVIMMILGEVGNFAAYGFAPASVVAPLGTSTVIANMFIAVIFLREQLRPEDLFGSGLAVKEHVFNAVQVVQALVSARFIIYITIEASALVVLFFLLYVLKRDNVLVLLLITSIIASMTVICAKAVSGLLNLTIAGSPQYRHPVLYIMAVIMLATCILQVHYLNLAMKGSDSTVVVPTNFVFFTISAIASGIVFFNEFAGLYSLSIFMFLLGCLLSFIGVYFITFNRVPEADKAPAAAAAAASRDDDDATGPAAKSADASMESLTTDDRAGLIGDKQTAAAAGKKKSQKVLSGQFPTETSALLAHEYSSCLQLADD